MKPITNDVIKNADDFIFGLTEGELNDWFVKYKKKQYNVSSYVLSCLGSMKAKEQSNFFLRLFCTIALCFDSYEINIPLIKKTEVDAQMRRWPKRFDAFAKGVEGLEVAFTIADKEGQPLIPEFITTKTATSKIAISIFTKDENATMLSSLTVLMLMINDALKKELAASSGINVKDIIVEPENKIISKYFLRKHFDGVMKRLKKYDDSVKKLFDDFNELKKQYDIYTKAAVKNSKRFLDYLHVRVEIEKTMHMVLESDKKKKLNEVQAAVTATTVIATDVIKNVEKKTEALNLFDANYQKSLIYIKENLENEYRCSKEFGKLDALYTIELNNYNQLYKELPSLNENLEKSILLLNELMN